LPLVVGEEKNDPWAAEENDQGIEQQKRAEGRFVLLSLRLIEPQKLGKCYKWDRAVARVENDRVTEGRWNQEALLSCAQMPHEEIESRHPEEQDETVGAALLRESDMIGHECENECAWKSDSPGELLCQEKDHRDRERSENQRQNPEVSLRLRKRIKKMRE